ncbi:hypothetical protein OIU77_009157 [Salix suchowensis]|uniref:Uncharacterized protein n=1 Tax=Salix suchowensis TaxID=1278906 RepID=A0ABQ9ADE7_9ROSI|nr:hypothetical protein OIU77_009157 [Salix suchowensis]
MAISSVYPLNPALFSHSHSLVLSQAHLKARSLRRIIRRGSRVVVLSTHSNAKILKPNRKSRYGDSLSTYDTDDDFLLNDEFAESVDFEVDGNKRVNSQRTSGAREGGQRLLNERTSKNTHERSIVGKSYHTKNRIKEAAFSDINEHGKRMTGKSAEERYPKLYEEIDLDKKSIGLRDSDILKVLTSLTQVLSLSVEDNLKPKYMYLINELRNEVRSLTKYPTYLSLSLEQRIRPRHRFLVSLKKAPKGPFPLSLFVPTDESFCQQWAGTSVEKYLAFRQQLLLKEFAQKYERRGAQKYERRG